MGVMYLLESARFSALLNLPEDADIGKAINDAMRAIEHRRVGTASPTYWGWNNTIQESQYLA
jgi:hypothetical protein